VSYRDQLVALGDETANRVVDLFTRWQSGDLSHDEAVALIAAVIARANGTAVALADLSLAATLMLQLGRPVAALGLLPPDGEPDRLQKAATTLLAVSGVTVERVARLGRSEPFEAAARAYSDGIAKSALVVGWTRKVSPSACEICQGLAGTVLPTTVPMYHHTGCTCVPVPTTEEN
jgi:hypothetical protein